MDVLPRGLRWLQDSPVAGRLRPRISRFYVCLFGTAWNLALGPGHVLEALGVRMQRPTPTFDVAAGIAAAFFLLLAIRELALETHVACEAGKLVIRAPLAPWVRFDAALSEIAGLSVVSNADGTFQVAARMRDGADRTLPLGFETVPLRESWTRKRPFASPPTYASFLAGRLGEMLEAARGANGTGTGPGAEPAKQR